MSVSAHGSRRKIASGCTCNLCTLVRESYKPTPPMSTSVPAKDTRAHIQKLRGMGWTMVEIAQRTGYSEQVISNISRGHHLWTSPYLAEDVQSLPLTPAPGWVEGAPARPRPDLVSAAPVRAHIHALTAEGLSQRAISYAAGCSPVTIATIARGDTHWTKASIAERVGKIRVRGQEVRDLVRDEVLAA